ncbi:biotin--acetyl-CoA-carboxylase ligase [Flavobacterium akiainvivens]|uniref:Biotin--acetyl-CoA-carboxylase ligase n=1 Tax=Flavobacterium akiainvivens TaxID=1202724 RepID=A0A0M8MEQ5_9FLAO|nr:biotin--[acetyl-CoA-carboxylase] ligase [Flavobacterium akiainvivens]KOS04721.1 biotin--acetyl-CoA-carboxylase ligase [Flavobacterium akiainvivens]SFQ67058.1 BirA family transcriptional regulator, biotin operon repressor / biotin-[acetyl-CoA-carboxylase] ligase [Flavobacterium akiainvivens]
MNIIKLNAISSTNDYLKELNAATPAENFTTVVAEYQTAGKGQMGAKWNVEPGKNLTFSVLIKDVLPDVAGIFNLNVAVAVSVVQALNSLALQEINIKWPNDILAGSKKIGGILIENAIKPDGSIQSVIGIGLNVNQTDFNGLPKASSLAIVSDKTFDKEQIMMAILNALRANVEFVNNNAQQLLDTYHSLLFKKNIPATFEKDGSRFVGIIQGVSASGNLIILHENDKVAEYGLKEIALLY